jgi:thimet oligopeptidase
MDPAVFTRELRADLDRARELLPAVKTASPRTAATVLGPYNELLLALSRAAETSGLMSEVHPDDAVRDAARALEREVDAFRSALGLDRELYQAIAEIDPAPLDAVARRFLAHTLRDFRRAGVDRDEPTRARIRAIDQRLTELGQSFSKNIAEDTRVVELEGSHELDGLPADYIAAHAPGVDGRIRISTDYPDYLPFISYAKSARARRALYVAFRQRGGEANERLLHEILTLRAEKARLLGYAHWADYVTEDKMIQRADRAAAFIDEVLGIARERAERDYRELLERKRADQADAECVEDWEKTYYENLVKKERYDFDPQSVRPFFEYERVERGLLAITGACYEVSYAPAEDAEVWHEDVDVYDVLRDGERVGRIYLDMHPREGKFKHAAQFNRRTGIAGRQLPEGVLVCNFPNPRTTEGPALLEHANVVTMFHEFGHLMHHILGGGAQRFVTQSGVATEWDFVEAPSQMFEEWAWRHETLVELARHLDTDEPIAVETVDRMRAADRFGVGLQTVQQMFYASISLRFHTAEPSDLDMAAEVRRLQAELTPFRFVEGTRFHASFGHLYGYSALYYTYMWSLVIAKDLLTPFLERGLMDADANRRYRDAVLGPGGRKDAAELVRDFLGRDYGFDAFRDYLSA